MTDDVILRYKKKSRENSGESNRGCTDYTPILECSMRAQVKRGIIKKKTLQNVGRFFVVHTVRFMTCNDVYDILNI